MSEKLVRLGVTVLMAGFLSACGQKGPLYLPDAPGEVVTRPAATPPPAPESPAPEVASPEGTTQEEEPEKEKSAAPPPPQ
jgi:predicted small lipoprotein YifL